MKQLQAFILILTLCFFLVACGNGTKGTTANTGNMNVGNTTDSNLPDNIQDSASDDMAALQSEYSITEEELTEAGIISRGRWGSVAFNVSYNVPYCKVHYDAAQMSIYPHGHSFVHYDGYNMYVESLLDDEEYELETLFQQIWQQKRNEKYQPFYDRITTWNQYFDETIADITETAYIGDTKAVYFEYTVPREEDPVTVFGYSFMYNDQPMCVYTYYMEGYNSIYSAVVGTERKTFEEIRQYVQYLILSMQPYQGEAFVVLDPQGNFYNGFCSAATAFDDDSGMSSSQRMPLEVNAQNIVFFAYDGSIRVFAHAGDSLIYPKQVIYQGETRIDNEYLLSEDVTLENIFNLYLENRPNYEQVKNIIECKESELTVCDIPMKRYAVAWDYRGSNILYHYSVVYTFMLDGIPYIWNIRLYLAGSDFAEMSESSVELFKYNTELVADTLVRTIRTAPNDYDIWEQIVTNAVYGPEKYPFE